MQIVTERKVAILISDKIDFSKKFYKRQRRTLCIEKRANTSRRYNNYRRINTSQQSPKIYKAKMHRIRGRNSSTIRETSLPYFQ